jgi:hypothetical protein
MPKRGAKVRARDRRTSVEIASLAGRIVAADFVADLVLVDKVNPSTIQHDQSIIFGTEIKAAFASLIAQGRGKAKPKRKTRP